MEHKKENSCNCLTIFTFGISIPSSLKIVESGKNSIVVPLFASGELFSTLKSFLIPLSNLIRAILLSLQEVTTKYSDNALAALIPTPCKPPELLYPVEPSDANFAPVCSLVNKFSKVSVPSFAFPNGIPLPLSTTVIELFLPIITSILVHSPAKYSSIEFDKTSKSKCWTPLISVLEIYIPGRFLMASIPSKVVICFTP